MHSQAMPQRYDYPPFTRRSSANIRWGCDSELQIHQTPFRPPQSIKTIKINMLKLSALLTLLWSVYGLGMTSEQLQNQLKATHTGRAILLLAALHGSNELLTELESIKGAMQSRIDKETESFQLYDSTAFQDLEYYSRSLKVSEARLASLKVQVKFYEKAIARQYREINQKAGELEQMKAQRAYIQKLQTSDEENFITRRAELNKGVTLIDQAIELLSSAKNTAFVEGHSETYQVIGETMLESLDTQFVPISTVFSEIGYQKFADHEIIRKTTRILQKLRNDYTDSLIRLNQSFQGQKQQFEILLKQYEAKISQIESSLLKVMIEQAKDAEAQQKNRKLMIVVTQQEIEQFGNNQKSVESEVGIRRNNYQELLSLYKQEIEIIETCISEVKKK